MGMLVKHRPRRTYKFMQTVEKKVGDALIAEGKAEGLSLQDQIRVVLGEWYRRNNHGS